MPLIGETSTSITIATRHFSSFFIAMVAEQALPTDIGTGFRAGEDDFQTPNYGSYIAANGHCAGQSLAMMWYFEERASAGAPKLFGRYDNDGVTRTPTLWRDDAAVYRLASSVQRDIDWDTLSELVYRTFMEAKAQDQQWLAFRYAMLVTGMPQFVGLTETGKGGGHAIVAYAATATGLWVADPNFPGKRCGRSSGTRRRARSGPTCRAPRPRSSEHAYDAIGFYGRTALVDWAAIGRRWGQVDDGTVGSDRFPTGTLKIATAAGRRDPRLEAARRRRGAPVEHGAAAHGSRTTRRSR